jgi:2-methylcitrate dehydratase PrpD
LIDPGILFKSYPVCSAAQAAAELTLLLMEQHGLTTDDIDLVICEVPPLVALSLVYHRPESSREAQFSMPFAVGCMLTFGGLRLEHLKMDVLFDPELQQHMQKVTMHVPEFLANDPTVLQRCPEGAGVTLITNNQVEIKDFLERPTGMPGNPVSTQALVGKFQNCFMHSGKSNELAMSIADELLVIDKCPNIQTIYEKLGA